MAKTKNDSVKPQGFIPLSLPPEPEQERDEPTEFGQQILDTILDAVSEKSGLGFIGWSVGKTVDITAYVAKVLGKPDKSVDGGIAHLVADRFLSNDIESDDDRSCQVNGQIAIRHKGWLAYSKFAPDKLDPWNGGYDHWIEWDGVDGTAIPFRHPKPNWRKLASKLAAAPVKKVGEAPIKKVGETALVPSPPETAKPLWEMDQFELTAIVKNLDADQLAEMIRNALGQGLEGLKRGATWYWTAGRLLTVAHAKHGAGEPGEHGQWGLFCQKCEIARSTAHKWMKLYDDNKLTGVKCFSQETFNLTKALGYYKPNKDEKKEEEEKKQPEPEAKKPVEPEKKEPEEQPKPKIPGVQTIRLHEEENETEVDEEEPDLTDDEEDEPQEEMVYTTFTVTTLIPKSVYDKVAKDGRKLFIVFDHEDRDISAFETEGEAKDFNIAPNS